MKKAFFLLLFISLFGCTPKRKPLPEGLLTHQEMVRVMIDVHLLEAKIKRLYVKQDSSSKLYHHYEKMLFKDLGIEKQTYEQSVAYYVSEIAAYEDIYDEVVDSLLSRQKSRDIR